MTGDRLEKRSGGALVYVGSSADSETVVVPAAVSAEAADAGDVGPPGGVVKGAENWLR